MTIAKKKSAAVHPKVKAAAAGGTILLVVQLVVQALAGAKLPGVAGEILDLLAALLAAYATK